MTQGGTLPAKKGGVKRHVSGRVYTCIIAFPQFTYYFEMPSTQFLRICEALFEKNLPQRTRGGPDEFDPLSIHSGHSKRNP